MVLATAPRPIRLNAETFTVSYRAFYHTVKVAGGGPSVHACAVFFRVIDGDKRNSTPNERNPLLTPYVLLWTTHAHMDMDMDMDMDMLLDATRTR